MSVPVLGTLSPSVVLACPEPWILMHLLTLSVVVQSVCEHTGITTVSPARAAATAAATSLRRQLAALIVAPRLGNEQARNNASARKILVVDNSPP